LIVARAKELDGAGTERNSELMFRVDDKSRILKASATFDPAGIDSWSNLAGAREHCDDIHPGFFLEMITTNDVSIDHP
jgi:hypothetical protein